MRLADGLREAKLNNLRVKRHIARLAILDGAGLRRQRHGPDPRPLPDILLAKLDNLADPRARVCAE